MICCNGLRYICVENIRFCGSFYTDCAAKENDFTICVLIYVFFLIYYNIISYMIESDIYYFSIECTESL